MEKFLSKEVLRYSLYKTVVWFITIVVKEGQKNLNVSYSKSTIITVTNHTDETINIKYSNVFKKVPIHIMRLADNNNKINSPNNACFLLSQFSGGFSS